jgi:hypothetical protein
MKVIKRHPLAALILFVLLGIFVGSFGAEVYYQRQVEQWRQESVIAELYWQSDESVYGSRMLGGFIGGMVSFAIGLVGYTIIKRSRSEPSLSLNLRNNVSGK